MSKKVKASSELNERVVEEIRVWMTRRAISQEVLAASMGVSQVWVSRRIGKSRSTLLDMADLELFAEALRLETEVLLGTSTGPSTGRLFAGSAGADEIDDTFLPVAA